MKKQNMRTLKKRRRKGKTDYKARLSVLKSSLPRIVVRKTNRYITAQYVKSIEAQDYVVKEANSKELLKYGWPEKNVGSLKSLPACYFTGLLLGNKIKQTEKEKKAILDMGLIRNTKGSRIYAVLKGLIDSKIEIKHKKDILPDEKRIKGEHLKNKIEFEKIKNNLLK